MTDRRRILGLPRGLPDPDPTVVSRLSSLLAPEAPVPDDLRLPGVSDDGVAAALVALVPEALARHRSEGVAEDVTRETLGDVGRKHARYGAGAVLPWLIGLLRGDVVSAGRLQVERRAGADGHALHVPETGPLRPDAVSASLDRARELTGAERFSCTSWLLDPVLRERLPGTNIARFAERFRLVREAADPEAGSRSAAQFVFVRPLSEVLDPAAVVPVTRLERLVALRLREGSGWREPVGVLTRR